MPTRNSPSGVFSSARVTNGAPRNEINNAMSAITENFLLFIISPFLEITRLGRAVFENLQQKKPPIRV